MNVLKKGNTVHIKIDKIAFGGSGIGRLDNMVVFVPFTAGGDTAEVTIKEAKKNYCTGKPGRIISPSTYRTEARCPYFSKCGGCQYQHITYEHQLDIKENQVFESFERIGKIKSPPVRKIISSPLVFNYRGKAEYHSDYGEDGTLRTGFLNIEGNELVDIERCEIMDESINRTYLEFRKDRGRIPKPDERHVFWSGTGYKAERYITRVVKDKKFKVPYGGFFQGNISLVDTLVECVMKMGEFSGSDTVLDCYCGSGLFSLFLASKVLRVLGMDSDEKSIRCARENLKNYGLSNAEFITGKAGRILKNMASEKTGRINAVILDPPRTGCEKDALDGIVKVKPERIVYVACNPATQARDIRYLCDHGFLLTELQPVDMFPQTAHIEVVALLKAP